MSHRFYIAPSVWNPEKQELAGEEAHHAVDVLRLASGDPVVVFDGRGTEQSARVRAVVRDGSGWRVELDGAAVSVSGGLACRIALGQAVPKGKNMDLIVQKATELGATAVHPILSERTVVRLDPDEARSKQEKWQRVAIEACKQSGQNVLPAIGVPEGMASLLTRVARDYELVLVASLQPGARRLKEILAEHRDWQGREPASVLVLIGPEGDFTPAEVGRALAAGAQPMTLGPIILRTETAAIYSLSILAHELL